MGPEGGEFPHRGHQVLHVFLYFSLVGLVFPIGFGLIKAVGKIPDLVFFVNFG